MLFGMVNERSMVKYLKKIHTLHSYKYFVQMDKRATQKRTFEKASRMTKGPHGINDSIGCRQTKMWTGHACFKNIVNFYLSSMHACSDLCLGHKNHADQAFLTNRVWLSRTVVGPTRCLTCSDLCLGHENHADTSELQFKYS